MNIYITLFAAVALEVLGTMLLPVTKSFTKMLQNCDTEVGADYVDAVTSSRGPLFVVFEPSGV